MMACRAQAETGEFPRSRIAHQTSTGEEDNEQREEIAGAVALPTLRPQVDAEEERQASGIVSTMQTIRLEQGMTGSYPCGLNVSPISSWPEHRFSIGFSCAKPQG